MFIIIKIFFKTAYIVLALLILIRTFLKANGISPLNFEHRDLLKSLYDFTDSIISPVNFVFKEISVHLPTWAHNVFPNFTIQATGGYLEWSSLFTVVLCLILGIILENYFLKLETWTYKLMPKTKKEKPCNTNNKTLQRLKEDTQREKKNQHQNESLKSAYNLIIKRLDREKTELLNKNIILEKELITDPLTGLKNRKYMEERLRYELKHCKLRKSSLSIIMIDIDHFKKINDTYGHQVGDNVLREVSKIIINACHGSIVASRYGGEEILIIGPKIEQNEAQVLAESIRKTIEASIHCGNNNEKVTISAGITTYHGEKSIDTTEALVKKADSALYQAKNTGRNRVKSCSI